MGRRAWSYATAVGLTAASCLLVLVLQDRLHRPFYSLFTIAVMITAWLGGLGPGLLSSVLGALAINYFFQEPRYQLQVATLADAIQLTIFMCTAVMLSAVTRSRDRARHDAARATRQALYDESLADLARKGADERDSTRLVSLICEQATKLAEADYAGLVLLSEGDQPSWTGMWGNRTDAWLGARASASRIVGRALSFGRAVVSRAGDEEGQQPADPVRASEGGVVDLAIPLASAERELGVLVVGWRRHVTPGPEQLRMMETLGGYAGAILDNALSHAELERQHAEAQALAELVRKGAAERDPQRTVDLVCSGARDLVGADYAALTLIDELGNRLRWAGSGTIGPPRSTSRGRGMGPSSQALASGDVVVLQRIDEQPEPPLFHGGEGGKTALAAPVLGRDGLSGALHLGWRSHVEITAAQRRIAATLASYAAVIVENARAHATVEERAAALAVSEERLRQLSTELEQRVEERTAELLVANEELQAFSYSVAHDLQGPLRAIHGFTGMLVETQGQRMDDEGKSYVARIQAASLRMARLIDDLLGLARLSRSNMDRQPVNLTGMAREILSALENSDPSRTVTTTVQPGLATRGDPGLLHLALENLLGNAWKFTSSRPSAEIEFGATKTGDEPAFFVRDNGVGFDMAYAHKLFKPFQRLHGLTEFAGTGIGLATVQRVVQRHGGRVWAEAAPEQGATVYFTLDGARGDHN
ncbi:MAG TPA: GAF domain-containing protein [Chloroflexota bacterium]